MPVQTPRLIGFNSVNATGTTLTVTTTDAVAAGERIFVVTGVGGSTSGTLNVTVSDSAGNTYASDVVNATVALTGRIISAQVTTALPAGSTITVTFTGVTGTTIRSAIVAAAGGLTTSAFDVGGTDVQTSGSSYSVNTTSAGSQADEILIGVAFANPNRTHTPGSGWTELHELLAAGGARTLVLQWKASSNADAGVQNTSGSWSSAPSTWVASIATYKISIQTLAPDAITSSEAAGTPALSSAAAQQIAPETIASTEAVGDPTIGLAAASQELAPQTIASVETVGQPTVANVAAQQIAPDTIVSGETVGTPTIANVIVSVQTLTPSTIASGEQVGSPTIALVAVVTRDGIPGVLRWEVTSLHYPDQDAEVLAQFADVADGEVVIPLKDARTAKVTLSVYDHRVGELIEALAELRTARGGESPIANSIDAYATMLRCYYDRELVFWGPITEPEWNGDTLTLHAVDPSIRLQHHYLVLGDTGLSEGDPYFNTETDEGQFTTDYTGLRALRDAGLNTAEQTARGVPDLGIIDGINDSSLAIVDGEFVTIAIRRGEEVWTKMKELAEPDVAPDFELEPIDDTPGAYARLNIYTRQGDDQTVDLIFQYGFGQENLAGFQWTPGGKIVTHSHKVSQDSKTRATRADEASSAWRGIYVTFEGTEHNGDPAVLAELAEREVTAYGKPPDFMKVTLPPDVERDRFTGRFRYLQDFIVGDTIIVEAKKGYMRATAEARITQVALRQTDATGVVTPELELVPSLPGDLSDEGP